MRPSRSLVCPQCGGPKSVVATRCRNCSDADKLTPQTLAIIDALRATKINGQIPYGPRAEIARRFGLSRERVSAIAKRHKV